MKTHKLILSTALCFWLLNSASGAPPTPAVIGKTAEELWRASKFVELEKYLMVLAKKYPKRVVSHVAMAFVEGLLHGDRVATARWLKPIGDAIDAHTFNATEQFIYLAGRQEFAYSGYDDPEFAARNEQLKRNPEVAKTRAFYGSKLPELIQLLALSPDVELP